MDRRQNNRMLRQCPSGIAQHHAIAVPTAMQSSHKDNVRSSAAGKQLKQKKSDSLSIAQHHLSGLDLFWASFVCTDFTIGLYPWTSIFALYIYIHRFIPINTVSLSELRTCVKVEVDVLGCPDVFLISLMVSVDVKEH